MWLKLRSPLLRFFLSSLAGLLAGLSAWIFLKSLNWVTETRESNREIIWALPLAGLFIAWVYQRLGRDSVRGTDQILDEIHEPNQIVPWSLAPLVFCGTLITHLFGGSAGREGTAVQMGAGLTDQLLRYFPVSKEERRFLLMAGAGAGFGAAIGAPWAGAIFGMEFVGAERGRWRAWRECLIASLVAFSVTQLLHTPHSQFLSSGLPAYSASALFWVAIAGALFGLTARLYIWTVHLVEKIFRRLVRQPLLISFVGGLLLAGLFYWEGSDRFPGLGVPLIQDALGHEVSFSLPLLKTFFTALTIGTGFKGGEFIPLVFAGTTLGSALGAWLPVGFALLSQLGFAAVFAGASNTPLACTVMAMEIFGWQIGGFALLACGASFLFSGPNGVYSSQKRSRKKFF